MYCGPGDSKVAIFPIASIRWELGLQVQKVNFNINFYLNKIDGNLNGNVTKLSVCSQVHEVLEELLLPVEPEDAASGLGSPQVLDTNLNQNTKRHTGLNTLHSTLRHAQLLSLRDQLQAKVDVLNKELDSKVPCQVV